MLAVKFALQHFKQEIQSRTVLILCDTATVVNYLRKDLCLLSWEILQICQAWQTCLLVRHIQSVIADSLSHSKPLSMEWKINPCLFEQSTPHSVDRSKRATSRFPISLPRREREGRRCAVPHLQFFGGVVHLSPTPLLTVVLGRI